MGKLVTNVALIAIVLMLSVNSCTDTAIFSEKSDEKKVILLHIKTSNTRGISHPIPNAEEVKFRTGDLYLVTSEGVIIRHFSIVETNENLPANAIYRGDFNSIVALPSVPGSVTEAVIVGNTQGNATSGNVAAVGSRLLNVIDQHDAWSVNLFGRNELQLRTMQPLYSPEGHRVWETTVHLVPTVTRFEIAAIAGTGNISSFTMEGIFVDNFYRRAQVNGTIDTTSWVAAGQDADLFTDNSPTFPSALFDWFPNGLTGLTVSPQQGNVWSYQLFASRHTDFSVTRPPNIVIRLRDVQVEGEANARSSPQFITVSDFLIGGDFVSNIHAGRVYHIPRIEFDEFDLSPRPNENAVTLDKQTFIE